MVKAAAIVVVNAGGVNSRNAVGAKQNAADASHNLREVR
jgi:hypothetical protein